MRITFMQEFYIILIISKVLLPNIAIWKVNEKLYNLCRDPHGLRELDSAKYRSD